MRKLRPMPAVTTRWPPSARSTAWRTEDSSAVLVLVNFHRFLQSAEIVQALAKQLASGKQNRTFVVILSPVVQVPTELEKLFIVIEHPLPSREQLEAIARGVATEDRELPSGVELQRLLDAAAGLTRVEAENAFSLSLVRHGQLHVETLWELKSQTLKKSGLLTLHRGGERFDDLGGLEALKAFCKRALRGSPGDQRVKPRGVLLLSPPGCGKSQFCKALGNETGRPTLVLDVGSLLGSLVGQSEANIRQALRIVDAMAPAVCFLDEVEKAFSGVSSSGQTDSGVSARLFGSFLSWLNDHESDVFVVATANDITKLPPEFSQGRAVRFRVLPRPAGRRAAGGDLADLHRPVSARCPAETAARQRLDRRGDQSLLPTGGAARHAADRGGPEHCPGRPHVGRIGREAAPVGRRSMFVGRPGRNLCRQHRGSKRSASGQPRQCRSAQQLNELGLGSRASSS